MCDQTRCPQQRYGPLEHESPALSAVQTVVRCSVECVLPEHPTETQIYNACLSYRHDFVLLPGPTRDVVVRHAKEWLVAWRKALMP